METKPPATLPSRGALDRPTSLARLTPRHKIGIAQMLLVAAVLAIAIDVAVPRPNVVLTNSNIVAPGCIGGATQQNVTASFTLVNHGTVDTVVTVTLWEDSTSWINADYGVGAGSSTQGLVVGTLNDCSSHRFELTMRYDVKGSS